MNYTTFAPYVDGKVAAMVVNLSTTKHKKIFKTVVIF